MRPLVLALLALVFAHLLHGYLTAPRHVHVGIAWGGIGLFGLIGFTIAAVVKL